MENVKKHSHQSEVHNHMEGADNFDKIAEAYDIEVRNQLAQYDELRKVLFDFISFSKDAKINVLELGVGTGTTAAEFLELYSNSRLVGVDISSKMIEQSRKKLEQFKSRAELVQCSFMDFQSTGQFDLVYSILSVHHMPDEDKETLFKRIRTILKSGSAFIIIDLVNGANDELTKCYQTHTFGRVHKEEGRALSLLDYVDWLRKAGFQTIDVAWKQYSLACLIAIKT
jgi:tRNA (cmo5U34)-methyltransferase